MTVASEAVNLDDILNRIQKLLALSSSPNEHEAALAAQKAQDLLFKYNLSMVDVEAKSGEKPLKERYNNQRVTLGAKRDVINWKRDLLHTVANNNFCRAISWSGYLSGQAQIIGKPTNIEAVMRLYDYLSATVDRLSAEAWEETKRMNGGKAPIVWSDVVYRYIPMHAKAFRSSFSHGAVATIGKRLREQRRANETASDQSSALVVVTDTELKAATEEFYGKLRHVKEKRAGIDAEAYAAGRIAGEKISLDAQVGSGSMKALRG